jgi:hypothetical protein
VTEDPEPLVLHYSRAVVTRHLVAGFICTAVLTYAVFVDRPARLLGSSVLARYGLPLGLVLAAIGLVIALVDLVHPPVTIEIGEKGVRLFAPPRRLQLDWAAIVGASRWYRLPLEPYGIRLHTRTGQRRIRFLSEASRQRVVEELVRREIAVEDQSPY